MRKFNNHPAKDPGCPRQGVRPGRVVPWRAGILPLVSLVAFIWLSAGAIGQPVSNLVFTVGTTIQDTNANNWSYVLLGAPEPQSLAGKRFAIFGKNGYPTNGGAFALRGTIFQQTDAGSINTLLNQSVSLGDDLSSLDNSLSFLLRNVPGISSQTLAQKVLTAFQSAAGNPDTASTLLILARMHPGLTRALGQAFAETISTTTTYEVRDVDPNTGIAGEVVGRVTITPGLPVILPAPGIPFQVVSNSPLDHLRVRLRWGTPDALRRLSLLQFGYNVWRLPAALAIANGFNVNPPSVTQLHSQGLGFSQVSSSPVMATKDYAPALGAGGPDDPTDLVTYFYVDGNGRSLGSAQFPPGQTPPGYLAAPFNDGGQFYYYITARDVLGRDGLVSPGGVGTACRKELPAAPKKLSVLNSVKFASIGGVATNQQNLLVRWMQNTNPADLVTQYWVYRWPNPAMALTNELTPSNNVVGIVAALAGTNMNVLLDLSSNGPAAPGPSNYWYTVRAVSQSACGQLLFSPNSAPASGVVRQHAAPAATTGELVGSCGEPVAMFQQFNSLLNPNGPDTNNWNYRITVTRRDAGIAWAQIVVGNNNLPATVQTFGPLYFPPNGNSLSVDFALPASTSGNTEFDAGCVVGTYYGTVSQRASCLTTNAPPPSQITEAVFSAGELLFTALSSSDPFLAAVNLNQSDCVPAVNPTRDESGTVHMRFNAGNGPMMIQYATNSALTQVWTDVGVATPDTNGIYSIYLCPCVISPLPPLRGCTVNLPGDGNCGQHVSSAGNTGAVAPIQVRFRLTPRTREYRLYRSVNGAPPTFIAQSEVAFDPNNPASEIVRSDDAMPPSAARLCYFVQLLDENGNGSPLALIGCKDVMPPKPPTPVLSEPAPAGNTTNPLVTLNWFCPTSAVYRFEIRLERADQPGSGKPTGFVNPLLVKLTSFKPLQSVLFTNPVPKFFGLTRVKSLVSAYDEFQLTPPVGPGFGPGPQFSISANVVPGVPYKISVAAENAQGYWGDASTEWTFTWQPPPAFPTVPWPARPLPPVTHFDNPASLPATVYDAPRVSAVMFATNQLYEFQITPDVHYPVAIRFAQIASFGQVVVNIGNTNFASYSLFGNVTPATPGLDPNSGVFKRYSSGDGALQSGQALLPIVVYRKQETNGAFPKVTGNFTQVTPLLEKVPWRLTGSPFNFQAVTIPDPLIALWEEEQSDLPAQAFLGLRDQQPVILGARYHYYVVRFDGQHEVAEVIDAGTVDIPSQ